MEKLTPTKVERLLNGAVNRRISTIYDPFPPEEITQTKMGRSCHTLIGRYTKLKWTPTTSGRSGGKLYEKMVGKPPQWTVYFGEKVGLFIVGKDTEM